MIRRRFSVAPILALPFFLLGIHAAPAQANGVTTVDAKVLAPLADDPGTATTGHRQVYVYTEHTINVTGGTPNASFDITWSCELSVDSVIKDYSYFPAPPISGPYGSRNYNGSGQFSQTINILVNPDLSFGFHDFNAYTTATGTNISSSTKQETRRVKINLTSAPVDPGGS